MKFVMMYWHMRKHIAIDQISDRLEWSRKRDIDGTWERSAQYIFLIDPSRVDVPKNILVIDCGFKIRNHRKLRLRGIDTPELDTSRGEEARRFVENRLKGLPLTSLLV